MGNRSDSKSSKLDMRDDRSKPSKIKLTMVRKGSKGLKTV